LSQESRYSKIFVKIWHSKDFRTLSEEAKMLFMYLLTSPHRNMGGFYYLPLPYLCYDIGLDEDRVKKAMEELIRKDMAIYDYDTQIVLIKNWFAYNPIENENQAKGLNKQLSELPKSRLLEAFIDCVNKYCKYTETILKGLAKPFLNPSETLPKPYTKPGTGSGTGTGTGSGTGTETNMCASANAECVSITPAEKSPTEEGDGAQQSAGKGGYTQEFEEFWSVYPRKIEKKRAFRCWKARIKEGIDPPVLIATAKNYAAYCAKQGLEQRYIKHASTFLGPDKPFEEYINGPPETVQQGSNLLKEPKSWDLLRNLYDKYRQEEEKWV